MPIPGVDSPSRALEALWDDWDLVPAEERAARFRALTPADADELFGELSPAEQAELLLRLPERERRLWMRRLAPDDAADALQAVEDDAERERLAALLDDARRDEVLALLAYEEDDAGGLMSPRFVRVRPGMRVDEAIAYVRRQALEEVETIYTVYVLDPGRRLLGVVSLRELFAAEPGVRVEDVMRRDVVRVSEGQDQEEVGAIFSRYDLEVVPVVNGEGRMVGIVTVDDIVHVLEEEATEDVHKIGGTEALGAPYLRIGLLRMLRKRGSILAVLFFGGLLSVEAMARFEGQIQKVVALALFIPLIISSGGNAGSQATTLVVRAMATDDVRARDWFRVLRRELAIGLLLGALLGALALGRVLLQPDAAGAFGEHFGRIGLTAAASVVVVVVWGCVTGSMLPFLLRRLRLDPAAASAPTVATIVDFTGLLIYFTIASALLGALLR